MSTENTFDPLEAKYTKGTEAATNAIKRELRNILNSYVGYYDPFCELIQNALDSIEERAKTEDKVYQPKLWITIDIKDNSLTVSDNGIGLNEVTLKAFLAPDFSFKSGNTRGHKGVGATFLAYGYNFMQIYTKTEDFTYTGKMVNARKWLDDENPSGNPLVKTAPESNLAQECKEIDKGVSIRINFDSTTHPADLGWVKASSVDAWHKILSIKTGLGSFFANEEIQVHLKVVNEKGETEEGVFQGIQYLWPHTLAKKIASLDEVKGKMQELYEARGPGYILPPALKNLDVFYGTFKPEELEASLKLDENQKEILEKYKPYVYFSYVYSAKLWSVFNESLNIRSGLKILAGGFQISANNMPQGEIIQIPLTRNIGRQNQVHFLIHFENCSADLGRKGFRSDIVDFCKEITAALINRAFPKYQSVLRKNTGLAPDLVREAGVDTWKQEMLQHEIESPLQINNENFFLPTKKIGLTSTPTREQDVIALFHQLIAGGVIRGLRIMSTNERLTYDGLYKISIEPPAKNHEHHTTTNPLGILPGQMDELGETGLLSAPKILEYKFSLDGLIEDIENGVKNSNDISLVVVWETGSEYEGNYMVTSLLDPDNLDQRQYHGVTHVLTSVTSQQREMDLIVLSELIDFLNDPEDTIEKQKAKYEY
ncbi:ATP-binding protein [Patescibacteria group bacterium]|nr:ATP-binding protein [Patescibacteria group bacterium]